MCSEYELTGDGFSPQALREQAVSRGLAHERGSAIDAQSFILVIDSYEYFFANRVQASLDVECFQEKEAVFQ